MISLVTAWLAMLLIAAPPEPPATVTAVRIDDAFQMPGSDGRGLVVSITIARLEAGMTAGNFVARIWGDGGKPAGEIAPLAFKSLDGPDRRWVLLETSPGRMQRIYGGLIRSNAAVVHNGRKLSIDKAGHYEIAYFVGPTQKQGAIAYVEDRPTAAGWIAGPFTVPSK